jgi:excinuclease UvrABC nuclease subunit
MHFDTGRAVRNASLEDLQKAPGVSALVARQAYDSTTGGRVLIGASAAKA